MRNVIIAVVATAAVVLPVGASAQSSGTDSQQIVRLQQQVDNLRMQRNAWRHEVHVLLGVIASMQAEATS